MLRSVWPVLKMIEKGAGKDVGRVLFNLVKNVAM